MQVIHKNNKKWGIWIMMGVMIVGGISGLCVGLVVALTYQNSVDLQFTWNPSVMINLSGDLLIPELAPGNAVDSNIITVTAGTNEANGYTLFSNIGSTSSNYTDLRISSSNTTDIFTNLSSTKTTLADFDDNTWGYSYCDTTANVSNCETVSNWVNGNAGSAVPGYNGLPLFNSANTATGIILADSNNADQTTLKFKIGAKASAIQASGTYTNVVNFIGLAKVVTTNYSLSYVDNSGEATGMPSGPTIGATTNGSFNVTSTVPLRTGYVFKGWCTVDNSADSTSCAGDLIEKDGLYVIGSTPSSFSGTVYAVWSDLIGEVTIATAVDMQEVNSCPTTLPVGQVYVIRDSRDGTMYHVARLADGNCWMLDNMALDLANRAVLSRLTSSNTNASDVTLGYLKNGGGTVGDQYPITTVANWTSGFSYSEPLVVTSAKDTSVTSYGSGGGKAGVYYNYCSASAGSYCYGDGENAGSGLNDSTEDICPLGWRMPSSGSTGEYQALFDAYSNNTSDFNDAFAVSLPGFYLDGTIRQQGNYGYYWSSTFDGTGTMYHIRLAANEVIPTRATNHRDGASVRCIFNK